MTKFPSFAPLIAAKLGNLGSELFAVGPSTSAPASAKVVYQPLGVVGIVSPWNFPVSLALTPFATALAAGNRVMLKPSEMTPAPTDLLAAMFAETFTTSCSTSCCADSA